MRGLPTRRLGAAVLFPLLAACAEAGSIVPLEIEVRARALAPGELVRIDVHAPEPLDALSCRFLDSSVFLSDSGREGRWSGWTLIALDEQAGSAVIEVTGSTAAGVEARGTRAVAIEAREFPEERLEVASKYVTPPPEVQERLAEERKILRAIYRSRTKLPPPDRPFVKPVPGEQSSIFGTRRVLNGEPRSPHPGVDLRGAEGTPVVAAGPGHVVLARDLYYSGNTVILDHGGGLFTLYAHLSEIDTEQGTDMRGGERVGLVGATGRVTGPHLHWGAKVGDRPFDPFALLDPSLFD